VHRNQGSSTWVVKAASFNLAAAAAGFALGSALGALGGLVSTGGRSRALLIAGAAAVVIVALELRGHRLGPPQRDRETPQRWLHHGSLAWSARNGVALGAAVTSRIGFWLWYAVPVGAFLSASPLVGGLVYGLYGAMRAAGVWALLLAPQSRRRGLDHVALTLVRGIPLARSVTRAQLLLVGLAAVAAGHPW
jgi:hypothetical protein